MRTTAIILSVFLSMGISVMGRSVSVIPQPAEMSIRDGSFIVTPKTRVICPEEFIPRAGIFASLLRSSTGYDIPVVSGKRPGTGDINLVLSHGSTSEDGYRVDVEKGRVTVVSSGLDGLFYGLQTLRQLLPVSVESASVCNEIWDIPCVSISDSPRFSWRGYMLDVSRTFYGVDVLKKYIDIMSLYKMNVFHLHLTDDQGWRIEIRKYPELTAPLSTVFGDVHGEPSCRSGYYTQDEIRDLVAYARDRNVTIVPEIDVPGHSWAALLARPELGVNGILEPHYVFPFLDAWSYWGVQFSPNTLDPSDERVYAFLDDVFTEIAELFPSEYIHFGGDEAKHHIWAAEPHIQEFMKDKGMESTADLQSWFVERVCGIIASKGKKPIGWNDILKDSDALTRETAIMAWLGEEAISMAAEKGMYTVAVPATHMYLDVTQADRNDGTKTDLAYELINSIERIYEYDPLVALRPEEEKYVLGVQANLWTHIARDVKDVNVQTFPRLLAVAESGWTPDRLKDFSGFVGRLDAHLQRLDEMKVDHYRPGGYIVGGWSVEGKESRTLEWDVTRQVYAAGRAYAGFYYLDGAFLRIEKVELLKDGEVVSEDRHYGLADTFRATHKEKTYLYELYVDEYDPEAEYVIRADVYADTDGISSGNFTFSLSPYVPFAVTCKF